MPDKTRPYRELRAERLANPEVAAHYLEATRQNSPENLLEAMQHVDEAASQKTQLDVLRTSATVGASQAHKE